MASPEDDIRERTRQRMVELGIPVGADPAQLVERIAEEMFKVHRLSVENGLLRKRLDEVRKALGNA